MAGEADRPRPYRSDLRRQQVAQTRQRVVEAAVQLFGRQGYRATTFAQVAQEAGVSVKTVQAHGPKSALLRAGLELTAFGVVGETDVFATDIGKAILQVGDRDGFAALVGNAMVAINAPAAGLWLAAVGAAQGDHELSGFHTSMLASIRTQVERILHHVAERGWLRTDVPRDDLVEAFCIITSVETFARFVLHDRKSTDEYQVFVTRTVRETILAT